MLTRDVQTADPYRSAEAVWLALAGIESWCAWPPDLISVFRLDPLSCGRGSRIQFDCNHGEEEWTISYLWPEKRMDMYREIGMLKVLRRLNLGKPAGDGPVTPALVYHSTTIFRVNALARATTDLGCLRERGKSTPE